MSTSADDVTADQLLHAIKSAAKRAELRPENEGYFYDFVPILDLQNLYNPNAQIIYGRNGTGKTHLLRAAHEDARLNFPRTGILTVYIDCRNLQLGPALSRISVDHLLSIFYRRILMSIVADLGRFTAAKLSSLFLSNFFPSDAAKRHRRLTAAIARLVGRLTEENVEQALTRYTKRLESENRGDQTISRAAGFHGTLDAKVSTATVGTSAKIGAALTGNRTYSSEDIRHNNEKLELVYEGLAVIDYNSIREDLDEVIVAAGAQSMILLLDEWASISGFIQPLFWRNASEDFITIIKNFTENC